MRKPCQLKLDLYTVTIDLLYTDGRLDVYTGVELLDTLGNFFIVS